MSPGAVETTTAPAAEAAAQPQTTTFQTLAGKVALITGSGRGIGRGMALELAARGASIVINYAKSAEKAHGVVKDIAKLGSRAVAIQADVSRPEEIFTLFEQAVAHFGRLDIVISNSGTEVWSKEEDVTPADFDHIFNINCRGQFFVAQQGLKYLGRGGRIILMSSVAATMSGIPNHALYAGSKAAVEGFTRSFAVDCGEKGITVNAIAPGFVDTDLTQNLAEDQHKRIAGRSALRRLVQPDDVARMVEYLLGEGGRNITGTVLTIDAGNTA